MRVAVFTCALVLTAGCENVEVSDQTTGDTLCFSYFSQCVNPKFDQAIAAPPFLSCSGNGGAACHNVAGGVGGTFKIHAFAQTNTSEMEGNFFSAKAFANLSNPSRSLLLRKPLANSDVNHGGGDIFPNASDPAYQEMLRWISLPVQDTTPVDAIENPACATLFVGPSQDQCANP
ncbi:MAG: hypothetical protein ACE5LB_08925 [Acidiferrobacterales bacterium]